MRTRVNGAAVLGAVCAVLTVLPAAAEPPDGEDPIDERWAPSVAIVSGVTLSKQKAKVRSSCDPVCDQLSGRMQTELRPPASGTDWAVSPYVGLNLEIMSPAITAVPGRPRVFLSGAFIPLFGVSQDIAKERDPKGFQVPNTFERNLPLNDPNGSCPGPPPFLGGFGCHQEGETLGVGSRTTAETDFPAYTAALGLAFPFEFRGRQLRVKPSFGWLRHQVKVDGRVLRYIKPVENRPFDREIWLNAKRRKAFNAIGPGIELELDVPQIGPVVPTLFVEGYGYHILGNRKVRLSDAQRVTCPTPPGLCGGVWGADDLYSANWRFKVDRWLYRGGLGLRFRWVGN